MRVHAAAVLSLTLGLGCSRGFSPIHPVEKITSANGTPCASSAACSSGICADGVCCERSCPSDEICNAPRAAGTCQPRPAGDACTAAAQCPNGWCFDGVCCSTDCSAPCKSCSVPGAPGLCQDALDDTDPRHDCSDVCSACFHGECAPAIGGSDPDHDCNPGLVCSDTQTCRTPIGGACSVTADCATGTCLAGTCLDFEVESVSAAGMNPLANRRLVLDAAVSAAGDEAIAFQEAQLTSADISESRLMVAIRPRSSGWRVFDLGTADHGLDSFGELVSSSLVRLRYAGRTLFAAIGQPHRVCADDPSAACGITVFRFSGGGALLGATNLPDTSVPGFDLFDLDLLDEAPGEVDSMYGEYLPDGGYQAVVDRLTADGGHFELGRASVAASTGNTYLGKSGGALYLVDDLVDWNSDPYEMLGFEAHELGGGQTTTLYVADGGLPCNGAVRFFSGAPDPFRRVDHDVSPDAGLLIEFDCFDAASHRIEVLLEHAPKQDAWSSRVGVAGFDDARTFADPRNWSVTTYSLYDDTSVDSTRVSLNWGLDGSNYLDIATFYPPNSLTPVAGALDPDGLPFGAFALQPDVTEALPATLYVFRVRR